jgi:hypothetical protein
MVVQSTCRAAGRRLHLRFNEDIDSVTMFISMPFTHHRYCVFVATMHTILCKSGCRQNDRNIVDIAEGGSIISVERGGFCVLWESLENTFIF